MTNTSPVDNWRERLSRWGAPVTYVAAVVTIGLVLVAVITRSPDTKANYQDSAAEYHRTPLANIEKADQFLGLTNDNLGADGGRIFVQAGCANCHGLLGQGAAVGPPIWSMTADKIGKAARSGDVGMPAFGANRLSDAQIAALTGYINEMRKANPKEPEIKPAKGSQAQTPP